MSPKQPAPATAPTTAGSGAAKSSWLKKVVYAIILLVALSLLLQFLGVGVMDRRESDTLIERPHAD